MTPTLRTLIDPAPLLAFLSSGMIWIVGAGIGPSTDPVLPLIAAAYVVPGSLDIPVGFIIGILSFLLWIGAAFLRLHVFAPTA